ncbi:MAG: 3-hydroxyacyl-CoA dehydrogenase [Proteobacteria bacterium]|nr:MAG: 3-hydroxyacyl-CoA dehydrogenase [Pseudomonadota bacterium]
MSESVNYKKQGQVAVLTADNPPVNALGQAVRAGLVEGVARAGADPDVKAIVILCAGRTFFAGADIREFGKPPLPPSLREVHEAMEASPKVIVSAIHGTALGGGCETALASHYRVAAPSAKIGVPEVNLGILPGAGGTQRLPRLIGVERALEMVVFGQPVAAKKAKEWGLIDEIVEGDLETAAVTYAERLISQGAPLRKISDIAINPASVSAEVFSAMRARIAKERRGYFAPERCIQAVEAAVSLPFAEGMKKERALFEECMATTHSKAQRYAFFAEREVGVIPGLGKEVKARPVAKVGVIGAGTMGGGIAMCFANAGIPVTVVEMKADALERGLGVIRKNYEATAARGRLSAPDMERRLGLITGSLDYGDLKDADLLIEAVFEDMGVKKKVFAELDRVAKAGAVLASNTSTLNLDEIARATSRPQDVIGLHFFSPANVMRLLEIVRGAATAPDTLATALHVSKTIGKVGVVSGVCFGFIGNRMLFEYGREAELLLLEGASPAQLDKALYDFGMAMGPCAMNDLAGVDVGALVRKAHRAELPNEPTYYPIADKLYALGRYGQKTGAGYYAYPNGSRTPQPDPEADAVIVEEAKRLGIARRPVSDQEIVERCIFAAANEGARILEEGIALRPGDIDTVWLTGYGFPVYRGGPMFYADTVGLAHVVKAIDGYRGRYGAVYWPHARLLEKLAAAGKTFANWREVM